MGHKSANRSQKNSQMLLRQEGQCKSVVKKPYIMFEYNCYGITERNHTQT